MRDIVNTPLFGVMISLIAFEIGCFLYNKTKIPFFNPLFISMILIIGFMLSFNINLDSYNKGGDLISFFLAPATVILAVPLYKQIKLLKQHAASILIGITVGSALGMFVIGILCKVLGLSSALEISMVPKSVTTPIGMEVSRQLGGIPSFTVAAIVITGIIGSIIGPLVCKLFRIKDKVAIGIAIGTASHALGTTKAMEIGETEGAMSSLSIGVAGLITVLLAPIVIKVLILLKLL